MHEMQAKWDVDLLQTAVLCELFPVIFLTTQYLSPQHTRPAALEALCLLYLSPLLVLGFTVERYISICHPFQRHRFCTTRRALMTIAALTTLSLCLHSVQAYFWKFYPDSGECIVRPQLTVGGMASVWSVWSWVTELSVFGVVPLTILALNVCVISETRKMSARDLQLNPRFTLCSSLTFTLR